MVSAEKLLIEFKKHTEKNEPSKISNSDEKELNLVFLEFAPTTEMDQDTFVKFCRETKSLNKSFRSTDASDLFGQILHLAKDLIVEQVPTINYFIFRSIALKAIAERKSLSETEYIGRLCRYEANHIEEVIDILIVINF